MVAADVPGASMSPSVAGDPRALLANYGNAADEWIRFLVADVLADSARPTDTTIANAYQLFRQEKALDPRVLPSVPQIATASTATEQTAPLSIVRLSDVHGVNALVSGSVIEPHPNLTVIYGENGTGKTGYSRIFKALANSRTADEILGNLDGTTAEAQSAQIDYKLGDSAQTFVWHGEKGLSPFTRMSIFDSRSVSYHVDTDLDYVYTPAALALFQHVIDGIRRVLTNVDAEITRLRSRSPSLLSRFPRESGAYPLIETLGAATDLAQLETLGDNDPNIAARIETLQQTVAALQANTIAPTLAQAKRESRVLTEASELARVVSEFDAKQYNAAAKKRAELATDYDTFRAELFAAADLPADPDDTWADFIAAGDTYRAHLTESGVHDETRCLYCRQALDTPSRSLLSKYSAYLEDKIRSDIAEQDRKLTAFAAPVERFVTTNTEPFVQEYSERDDRPAYFDALRALHAILNTVRTQVAARAVVARDPKSLSSTHRSIIVSHVGENAKTVKSLQKQLDNRTEELAKKQKELRELQAAAEIARSWPEIERIVNDAKQAERLARLKPALPTAQRTVTELSKTASDELINHNFEVLFNEEVDKLRAPVLKVQFIGREGQAKRRKVLSAKHRPSLILSEGEQKVLAIADFLAEARLAGITAPVIFDDPVSSLDHRRIREVAERIASLAADNQVIVFTHDILFTTNLLAHFEKSKLCTYFQITDEYGKGQVSRATGPRIDSISTIKGRINSTIQAAKSQQGESRDALVHTGYSHIRSWCELFTEDELLQGVTRRYQANVQMTRLAAINAAGLPAAIELVTRIFEDACRYTDAHSQSPITQSTQPTVTQLEADWKALQECQALYKKSD